MGFYPLYSINLGRENKSSYMSILLSLPYSQVSYLRTNNTFESHDVLQPVILTLYLQCYYIFPPNTYNLLLSDASQNY